MHRFWPALAISDETDDTGTNFKHDIPSDMLEWGAVRIQKFWRPNSAPFKHIGRNVVFARLW